MNRKRQSSSAARVAAVLALTAGFVVLGYVVVSSLGSDDERSAVRAGATAAKGQGKRGDKGGEAPKVYVVEPGDTLDEISDKTGVEVDVLEELNPQLDPQLLSPGERVKLR